MEEDREGNRISKVALIGGLLLIGSALLPSGWVEAGTSDVLRTYAWMDPLVWPLVLVGMFFLVAAFAPRTRRYWFPVVVVGAVASFVLLYYTANVMSWGSLYAFWFKEKIVPTDIRDMDTGGTLIHLGAAAAMLISSIAYKLKKRRERAENLHKL